MVPSTELEQASHVSGWPTRALALASAESLLEVAIEDRLATLCLRDLDRGVA
jgi:hypothetical protein